MRRSIVKKRTKMFQRIGKTCNNRSTSLLVSHRGCLDHEVPDRKGDLRIDHLEVAIHPEVESCVACQELKTVMVAVVGDLISHPAPNPPSTNDKTNHENNTAAHKFKQVGDGGEIRWKSTKYYSSRKNFSSTCSLSLPLSCSHVGVDPGSVSGGEAMSSITPSLKIGSTELEKAPTSIIPEVHVSFGSPLCLPLG